MVVSTRSTTRSSNSGTSTHARAQKCSSKRKRPARRSLQHSSSPSRPWAATLPDLPNELLHKIIVELPGTVETIITLATICRRLNEFAMAYHFGSDCYAAFGGYSQPFTSFRMLRLSFVYKPSLSLIDCTFSNNFHKEMTEIKRSLAVLEAIGTAFSVSFLGIDWPKMLTKKHIDFFEDISKLKCRKIDTTNAGSRLAVPTVTNDIIKPDPPALTRLSDVTLSQSPEWFVAWMLRSMNQSSVTKLCLHSLSDDNLLELNKLPLHHLRDVTLSSCTFNFAAFAAFLENHQSITLLDTRTWNPTTNITGSKGHRKSKRGLKTSLEPATRMSLRYMTGTPVAIRALLSTPAAFPFLESANIKDGDITETQEALLLVSHIRTAYRLYLCLKDLSEWLQFKFPRRKRLGAERAEPLLTRITDLEISLSSMNVILAPETPAAAALIPNLKRFRAFSWCSVSERAILNFVGKMRDACPGLETVTVNWSDFSTDPKWLQQRRKELDEKGL